MEVFCPSQPVFTSQCSVFLEKAVKFFVHSDNRILQELLWTQEVTLVRSSWFDRVGKIGLVGPCDHHCYIYYSFVFVLLSYFSPNNPLQSPPYTTEIVTVKYRKSFYLVMSSARPSRPIVQFWKGTNLKLDIVKASNSAGHQVRVNIITLQDYFAIFIR